MQNFVRILEKSNAAQLREVFKLKDEENKYNAEWPLLIHTEHITGRLADRLKRILPPNVQLTTSEAKVEFLTPAQCHLKLQLYARFYEMSRHEFIIKVFGHQETARGKSRKVVRARYRMRLHTVRQSA